MLCEFNISTIGRALVAYTVCVAGSGQDIHARQYRDVALENIAKSPQDFDHLLVKVHGICQIQFEGNLADVIMGCRG